MTESSTSAKRRDGEQGALLNSPVAGAPHRKREKDPPPYGAQYRQDAVWEAGGNEVLPPQWWLFKGVDDKPQYHDHTLAMCSWIRPLPGVRLGQ
ncbi:hypothetical protein P692DRAFT_20736345 [Suillus brevipes Sb2]|nr:hypothetical protein P692DRAFT_20736345 [Suillus brevipes Sb2]